MRVTTRSFTVTTMQNQNKHNLNNQTCHPPQKLYKVSTCDLKAHLNLKYYTSSCQYSAPICIQVPCEYFQRVSVHILILIRINFGFMLIYLFSRNLYVTIILPYLILPNKPTIFWLFFYSKSLNFQKISQTPSELPCRCDAIHCHVTYGE